MRSEMKFSCPWSAVLGGLLFFVPYGLAQSTTAHSPSVPQSKVECSALNSTILSRQVPYCVMLPPSYAQASARRYPVVYYLHGLGDNEQSLVNLGGWAIYDRLMREKSIGEFVLVAPAGFSSFYVNSRDGKFRYEDFFLHEFMPAMEKKYRIANSRRERGIMGVSMGGFGALHYAFKYPEMFAAVSASVPALIERLPTEFYEDWQRELMGEIFGDPPDLAFYEKNSVFHLANTASLPALKRMTIYFDCGVQDRYGFNVGTLALDKLLTRRGVPHEAHIYPGGHDWQYVLDHFAASLEAQSKALGARQYPE
jgi:S-formylglutathione hydrolase FrmB